MADKFDKMQPSCSSSSVAIALENSVASSDEHTETSNTKITDLPAEIFHTILRYLSFDNIAKVRLVSQHFNNMCSTLLNSEFNHLRVIVQHKFSSIKAQMPRRESSRRKHPLARECDIIETLFMRLTLLHMTFGKHMERKYCCFFAGEILDEIHKILNYVEKNSALSRAYKVTDELFDLSTMAMEYFKEHIEPGLPEVSYFSTDVFEYPTFSCFSSTSKSHLSLIQETAGGKSKTSLSPPSTPNPAKGLIKRVKTINQLVKKQAKELSSVKASVKILAQKINSLEEIVHQTKWQQKNSEGSIIPEMNEMLLGLNFCKHEIDALSSELPESTATSELNNEIETLQSKVIPAVSELISKENKRQSTVHGSHTPKSSTSSLKTSSERCRPSSSSARLCHSRRLRKRSSTVTKSEYELQEKRRKRT
ncbi:F-box only protein 28-like [Uloborus diversus]|uniref:F-box only protein 28-like n=1 Tax=Uloborus diversus TaxID=327109 RepID=UPI0024095354|nr:F-box only protein 28-like [Uloborus diversus]XP_054707131.1 F-box only protein 28-like [Uloborus diversus]